VKITTTLALLFPFLFPLAAQVQAEDHYIYKDAQGKLVISNKEPPPGSKITQTRYAGISRHSNATGSRERERTINRKVGRII
jgi:hypothetical protein